MSTPNPQQDLIDKYPYLARINDFDVELDRVIVVERMFKLALEYVRYGKEEIAFGITKVTQTEGLGTSERVVLALLFAGVNSIDIVPLVNDLIENAAVKEDPTPILAPSDSLVDRLLLKIIRASVGGRRIASLCDTLPGSVRGAGACLDSTGADELHAVIIASLGRLMAAELVWRAVADKAPGGMEDATYRAIDDNAAKELPVDERLPAGAWSCRSMRTTRACR